jgi:4-hydroxy-tetrahydrodipicolinate synthase
MTRPDTRALRGCGTALVTPFTADGSVDEPALRQLVARQLEAGIDVLVPCGSTGEAATLSLEEHARVVAITAEVANGRVPVVAGAGSSDTARAVALARASVQAGATQLLVVTPPYNKPPQRGLLAHFRAVADAVDVPIVLYNVPGRTGGNLSAASVLELAADPRFVAVKEASGDLGQVDDILADRPEGFLVLSGDDALTLPIVAMGGDGVISVVSNLLPAAMVALAHAAAAGNLRDARRLHRALRPVMAAAFLESNPVPAKAALAAEGALQEVLRLPLVPLADVYRAPLARAMAASREALAAIDLAARHPDPLD